MFNQEVADYIRQSRINNIADSDIKSALLGSGWDTDTIDGSFSSIDGIPPSISRWPKFNLKIIIVSVMVLLILGGYLFFANAQGLFPFSGAPSGVNGIFNAVQKASTIKSLSYKINFSIKSQPREANAKSLLETYPDLGSIKDNNGNSVEPQIVSTFQAPNTYLSLINGNIDASFDILGDMKIGESNPIDTRFQIGGKVSFGDFNAEADAEFLKKNDTYYIKINKFPALFFDLTKIKEHWVQVGPQDLPATTLDEIFVSSKSSGLDQTNQNVQSLQKFFQIAHDSSVIKVTSGPQKDTVNGATAYKYSIAFDEDKFPNFYNQVLTEMEDQLKDNIILKSDEASAGFIKTPQFKELFDYLAQNSGLNVWLNHDGYPVKLEFSERFIPENKTNDQEYISSIAIELSNIDKDFKYDAPTDYLKYEDIQNIFSGQTKEEYLAEQKSYPGGVTAKARDAKRIADLNQLRTAVELYYDDNGKYPTSLDQVIPKYITIMPLDPTTNKNYFYAYKNSGRSYHIWGELEGGSSALSGDSDLDSTGWLGATVNGKNETCAGYNNGLSRDCVYDLGQL